jgi:hypothetical protein
MKEGQEEDEGEDYEHTDYDEQERGIAITEICTECTI